VTALAHSPLSPGEVVPSAGAMARSGLWLELDLIIGFTIGLGLGSLMSQRTVPVILLIVLEIIITPRLFSKPLPHLINAQRLFFGVAMNQMKPAALAGSSTGSQITPTGAVNGVNLPPMPTWAMISVIAGWIIVWTIIGAWKMVTRDA
jgi:hypothetical protein